MKPNHSNSDIYGDIDSWSLKEAPERLKVNSDNLKEQIEQILCDGNDDLVPPISYQNVLDELLQIVEKERQEAYKKGYTDGGLRK